MIFGEHTPRPLANNALPPNIQYNFLDKKGNENDEKNEDLACSIE